MSTRRLDLRLTHGDPTEDGAVRPSRGSSPIRIAFVLQTFTYGGAEHDVIQLITESDPARFTFVGMAVQLSYPICPDLRLDHPRVPPIYQPRPVTRHPKVIQADGFASAVRAAIAGADIVVSWGVPNLSEVIPLGFRGRIVVTSKASGAYQESFLHANALLTSDYIANSVKSTEAFPEPVRARARVIYPGVEPRRLERTRSREEQRARWGMRRVDRLVGYLGRIAPDKGVEQLAKAVSSLPADWKAVFVGRNGNFPEFERKLSRLCRRLLPDRHVIVDWTTEIGDTIAAFDVLAYPTQDEGFSNSLAEAWLLRVPTVATEGVGSLAEPHWAGCTKTVPRDFTTRQLSRALVAAVDDRRFVARAYQRARVLTVERTIQDWQCYFAGLMNQPRRPRVMTLVPNLLMGGISCWLLNLMRHTPGLDWCGVCVMSEESEYTFQPELLRGIIRQGCPLMGIPRLSPAATRQRLLRAITHLRPDLVIQSGVKQLDGCFPEIGIPLVSVSHGPSACAWAREVLARSFLSASGHVAISQTSRDAFPLPVRDRTQIIPNGVTIPDRKELQFAARRRARREMGVKSSEIAVAFVGRLSPEKNPRCVAEAVARLPRHYRAVFIGPDCASFVPHFRKRFPRCIHTGAVPPEKVREWMPGLDVVVCPSDYESFGLAIVEAWSSNVPVVSTRVGVVDEWIDKLDVAIVVPFRPSAAVLAGAIVRAHSERESRVHACRELAIRNYDARRMGRDWQAYFTHIANHGFHPEVRLSRPRDWPRKENLVRGRSPGRFDRPLRLGR